MNISHEEAKSTLLRALNDSSISVVALTGKWGTGKSHLWKSVSQALKNDDAKPIYVSLFGVKTINELKLRIVQNARQNSDQRYKEYIEGTTSLLKGLAGKWLGVEVESLMLLSIPALLKERLVVIDDVERKHTSLDIDEVMGFINEHSEIHKSRFLLLLNQDKLTDKPVWEALHEKVIDVEVVLNPTPTDAFKIADDLKELPYYDAVRAAIEIVGINNIRVIRRICRVIKNLLGRHADFDEASTARVVPSTVLLTALHYRAIPDGPSMEYVTKHNSYENLFAKYSRGKDERSPEEIGWDSLLQKLKINYTDEYEEIVYSYLKYGVLDTIQLERLMSGYKLSADENKWRAQVGGFLDNFFWNHDLNRNDLIAEARKFLGEGMKHIDAASITSISDAVEELEDTSLAAQLIDAWIVEFDGRYSSVDVNEDSFERFHRKIHPTILNKFKELKESKYPPLTLIEAVDRIVKNSGWSDRERAAFSQSTVENYKAAIRNLKNDALGRFLDQHFSWPRIGGLMDDQSFAVALRNFESACRAIYLAEPDSRLGKILKREFQRYGKADRLAANQQ